MAGSDRIGIVMPMSETASLSLRRCSSKPALSTRCEASLDLVTGSWLGIKYNVDVINVLSANESLP